MRVKFREKKNQWAEKKIEQWKNAPEVPAVKK